MQKQWLQHKTTPAEAEARHQVSNPRLGPEPVAFGFQNARWRALLAKMQDGDELWTFASDEASWRHRSGRAGIALVRKGEIVDSLVTMMN